MRKVVIYTLLFCFMVCECNILNARKKIEEFFDKESFQNVTMLISNNGYPVEDHTVQTDDGYLLSIQRIPHGRNSHLQGDKKKVVLLLHGFLCSASMWVLNFPEDSLGFILADAGYDVWLGNARGSTYSRRNIKYTPDQNEFWDFSFDEMALYDLPAFIDYVLKVTNVEKIYYIGYSQGTVQGFGLLSENPEYNEKIKLFIALAPVAMLSNVRSNLRFVLPFRNEIRDFAKLFNINEILPRSPLFFTLLCGSKTRFICKGLLAFIFTPDFSELNKTRLDVYLSNVPSGSSVKSLLHYLQLASEKEFRKYDYGKQNCEYYHQPKPPKYDLPRITTPIALATSVGDSIANSKDVDLLRQKLNSIVSDYIVPHPRFNHLDFFFAIDARTLLYDHVLSLLADH